jgi:hypothetical protein
MENKNHVRGLNWDITMQREENSTEDWERITRLWDPSTIVYLELIIRQPAEKRKTIIDGILGLGQLDQGTEEYLQQFTACISLSEPALRKLTEGINRNKAKGIYGDLR